MYAPSGRDSGEVEWEAKDIGMTPELVLAAVSSTRAPAVSSAFEGWRKLWSAALRRKCDRFAHGKDPLAVQRRG